MKITATALLEMREVETDAAGRQISHWREAMSLGGFLDYRSGEMDLSPYDARVQESSHIFLTNGALPEGLQPAECRLVIGGAVYAVVLIDNVMELGRIYEIYLRRTGEAEP